MIQAMDGDPALKIYGNIFVGSGTVGNNGICVSRNAGGSYYLYNNTFIRHFNPGNTVRFLGAGTLYAENNLGAADFEIGDFLSWTMNE